MGLPLNRRDYDIFISYAHSDRVFVASLFHWLQETAGLQVWWDDRSLPAGTSLGTGLQKAIERCRAVILVVSNESLKRGWVEAEYNAALDERAQYSGFRIVALRMGGADANKLMKGISWIEVPGSTFDADTALAIVRALYPDENQPNPAKARDIYISASWRHNDKTSAAAVCRYLAEQGFRLIGDSQDQKGFGSGDRVERIMASCGAFVSILPYRGETTAVKGQKPYQYFLQEIDFAAEKDLPRVVIADPRIQRADGGDQNWIPMQTDEAVLPRSVQDDLSSIWDRWRRPMQPHFVFYAMDLDSDDTHFMDSVRQLVQLITSMPAKFGNEVHEGNPESANAAVRRAVCDAFLVIADLTDDNVNACIEAGMALAVGTNLELLAAGEPRRPPFMLRERNMPTYRDKVQQIGLIHKVCLPYRRRVINAEL